MSHPLSNELWYYMTHSLRKKATEWNILLMFWVCIGARSQQIYFHTQGDTVLVGGPEGEKGNKGETVSEHKHVFIIVESPLILLFLHVWFPFQGDRGPKGVQGEKGGKGQEGPAGEQVN